LAELVDAVDADLGSGVFRVGLGSLQRTNVNCKLPTLGV